MLAQTKRSVHAMIRTNYLTYGKYGSVTIFGDWWEVIGIAVKTGWIVTQVVCKYRRIPKVRHNWLVDCIQVDIEWR